MNCKSLAEYKADFLIGLLPVLTEQLAGLIFLKIVFNNIHTLSGNGYYECMMIYGFYLLASSIEKMLFGNFPRLKGYVFEGTFDLILLKPTHPILYMILMDFDGINLIQTFGAIVIIGYAQIQLNILVSLLNVTFILISVVYGVLFLGAVTIAAASIFFYTEGTFSLFNVMNTLTSYARYPITIFGKGIAFILKWILPLGMVSYFPTELLLNGNIRNMAVYIAAGGVFSMALFLAAGFFFTHSTRKYGF